MTMTMDRCLRYSEKLLRLLRPFGSLHMVTPLSLRLRYLSAQAVEAKSRVSCELQLAREFVTPKGVRPRPRGPLCSELCTAASLVHVAIAHDPSSDKNDIQFQKYSDLVISLFTDLSRPRARSRTHRGDGPKTTRRASRPGCARSGSPRGSPASGRAGRATGRRGAGCENIPKALAFRGCGPCRSRCVLTRRGAAPHVRTPNHHTIDLMAHAMSHGPGHAQAPSMPDAMPCAAPVRHFGHLGVRRARRNELARSPRLLTCETASHAPLTSIPERAAGCAARAIWRSSSGACPCRRRARAGGMCPVWRRR